MDFFSFCMEGGNERLCLLGCADRSVCLDSNDRGVGCGCFHGSCSLVWTVSGDVSLLIATEAKSALNSLSFFFVRESGSCPSAPDVHGIRVLIAECVPPLELCCSSSSFTPFDPFFKVDVFLLVMSCCGCPVVPCYWMIEFYAVCH